jgi:hypothetical protein
VAVSRCARVPCSRRYTAALGPRWRGSSGVNTAMGPTPAQAATAPLPVRTPNALLEPHSPELSTTWVGCRERTTRRRAPARSYCQSAGALQVAGAQG